MIRDFFLLRWRGEVALDLLIIRDMLVVGTLINLLTSGLSLLAFANGAPGWFAVGIFLLPLPYNLFLFACAWRLSGQVGGWRGTLASLTATVWLVAATVI